MLATVRGALPHAIAGAAVEAVRDTTRGPRRRPHDRPDYRLRILELRAARGRTLEHTAR